MVVVGSVGTGEGTAAEVWMSQGAGQPFAPVPQQSSFTAPAPRAGGVGTGAVMYAVVGGALGLFAAGTVNGRATIWYSTSGQNWQVLPGAGQAINQFGGAVVNSLVSTPAGVFAAGSYQDGNRLSGELWSSSDGIHWSNDGGWFAGAGDRVITSLVDMRASGNTEPGMLAVGGVRVGSDWQPAAWISPNGSSWSPTSEDFPLDREPAGSPGALVYAAAGTEGRLVAVGGSPGRQRAWTSSAGLTWSELPLPAAAAGGPGRGDPSGGAPWHLGLLAASGRQLLAADNLPGQPYVLFDDGGRWHQPSTSGIFGRPLVTATPISLINQDGRLTMAVQVTSPGATIGSGRTWVTLLASRNGQTWRVVASSVFRGYDLGQLLFVPEGLLAVGGAAAGAWAKVSSNFGLSWPRELISPAGLGHTAPYGGAVTAGRVGDSQYVVGESGAEAVGWYSPDGTTWEAARPLDSSPQLYQEEPVASCMAGSSAVVVGALVGTARGSLPAAWTSTDGSSWTAGTFSGPAAPSTTVDGCLWTGNGFVAYGGTGAERAERPILWESVDGLNWQQMSSTFTSLGAPSSLAGRAAAGPLDGIAYGTTEWLGLSGEGDLPAQLWPAPVGGQAGASPTPLGLWSSADAGNSWDQVATNLPVFSGALFAQAGAAVSLGQQTVLAGQVDGRLRVWVGSRGMP